MNRGGPVVLDTVVLSNFAASESLDDLVSIVDRPRTVPPVERELERAVSDGYGFADRAVAVLDDVVPVVDPETSTATTSTWTRGRPQLSLWHSNVTERSRPTIETLDRSHARRESR